MAMAAPCARNGSIGWQASPSNVTRPTDQRASGARSNRPQTKVSSKAANMARTPKAVDVAPLIKADVSYSPKFIYDAIKLTAEARLKGDKLPATTIIPSVLITKENAKEFYFPDSPF